MRQDSKIYDTANFTVSFSSSSSVEAIVAENFPVISLPVSASLLLEIYKIKIETSELSLKQSLQNLINNFRPETTAVVGCRRGARRAYCFAGTIDHNTLLQQQPTKY